MEKITKPITFSSTEEGGSENKKVYNITGIILTFLALIFVGTMVGGAATYRFIQRVYETLPDPQELADIEPSLVTRVYAADSTLLHEFSIERRFWMPLDSFPTNLQNAVIAIEDRRFRSHWGVDITRMTGAITRGLVSGNFSIKGVSTLTQQLARNIYFTQERSYIRKVREVLTAIQLESYFTKDEILEIYLNQIYLGGGVYGMEAASQRYFSKTASQLTLNECAVLAGTIQLPEHYRPDRKKNHERITVRRKSVLRGMERSGFISTQDRLATQGEPIPCNPPKVTPNKAPYFVEMVRQYLEKRYGEDELYNGGLSIYTTLDPVAQAASEKSLVEHLDTLQRIPNRMFVNQNRAWTTLGVTRDSLMDNFDSLFYPNEELFKDIPDSLKHRKIESSVVALETETGAIKVLIGGKDFNTSKFNRAVQSVRQPGSAFKPFVYATALIKGYTPASVVIDKPITLETPDGLWRPQNHEKEFYGSVSLRHALKKSINLVAIQVLMDVGTSEVIGLAKRMGLNHNLPYVPALAIGACEVTNMEITAAYAAFANGGFLVKPYYIDHIVDKRGRILEQHEVERTKVLQPETAALMTDMLEDVINHGTGIRVRRYGFSRAAAGKTGTTDNYSDAWFVGYTPQIACGVWTGVDEVRSMGPGVSGAKGSIPVWTTVMKELHKKLPKQSFSTPKTIITRSVCKDTYGTATKYCPDTYKEKFYVGRIPEECDKHKLVQERDTSDIINYFSNEPIKNELPTENSGDNIIF